MDITWEHDDMSIEKIQCTPDIMCWMFLLLLYTLTTVNFDVAKSEFYFFSRNLKELSHEPPHLHLKTERKKCVSA